MKLLGKKTIVTKANRSIGNRWICSFITLCFLVSGCSKVPPANDHAVICTLANRMDSKVEWREGRTQNAEIMNFIEAAADHLLTADIAIQIALLNNPKIQAVFEDIGIAQGDLVEAGLFSNPFYAIEIRYPQSRGIHTNIEYLITSSFLDLFLIPLRKKLASTEFEQTKLRVSNEILDLAFEVRQTYYELVSQQNITSDLHAIAELTNIVNDLSLEQLRAGNINELNFLQAQSHFLEAQLELEQSRTVIIQLREKLNRLLGFREDRCLNIPQFLPNCVDDDRFDLDILECVALEERLDLHQARFEIIRLCQLLGLKEWWTYTNFSAGLAGEREPDGVNVLGLGLSGEIPIFNYGQAARIRLYAQLRQAHDRFAMLEIDILSQTREAYQLLKNYREIVDNYNTRLLPLQSRISAASEELYNVMGLGVDQLLENKRQELITQRDYTKNMKNYLVAKVNLDRALGGYLFKLLDQRNLGIDR